MNYFIKIDNVRQNTYPLHNCHQSYFADLGNNVTMMSPDGKPIQVDNAILQSAVAQNAAGMLGIKHT